MRLILGDCLDVMRGMYPASVDSIVTDPPYGLSFMGKDWDRGVPGPAFWAEALRVAKPGAHLLAFGGTRTFHRLTCAIEDAGWEIRDCLGYLYGSGFPKSHNLKGDMTGWGTALKPAWEPIILARKTIDGTVAANVLKYGTGAININGCRVGVEPITQHGRKETWSGSMSGKNYAQESGSNLHQGRWPANLIHDGSEEVLALFPTVKAGVAVRHNSGGNTFGGGNLKPPMADMTYADSGSAARFFYCAKASRRERELGLDCIEIVMVEYRTWDNEDRKAKLRVDTGQFPPQVIGVSGTPDNDASEWNTFLFGSPTTGRSLSAIPFITSTATNSITESRTLSCVARWLINESTAGVNGKTANGINPAENADESIPLLTITREKTASRRGAGNVASAMRWTIKGNAASPADHPTVKPLALMRYLCRLVTPPLGVVLDPFMGSGSTGRAARDEGLDFIGIEISADYLRIAEKRIQG